MNRSRTSLLLVTLLLAGLLLSGSGLKARETHLPEDPLSVPIGESDQLWDMEDLSPGETGGKVKFSVDRFPETFNNLLADSRTSTDFTRIIMGSGLMAENPANGMMTPGMAKSWSVSEDGLKYTFNLRKGLKFSDGEPLTAEDVVFTYRQLVFNSKVKTDKRDILRVGGELPEIKKIDQHTVRFTLPKPYGPFLRQLSTGIYPKHHFKNVSGEEFNASWGRKLAKNDPGKIVGAGPFQLEEFIPGEKIAMKRNPYYYKADPQGTQLPYLDGYQVFKVKDNDVEFLKFKNGETDLMRAQIEDMPYLLSREDDEGWRVSTGGSDEGAAMSSEFLVFNWNTRPEELGELFETTKFRKAVSLAINRKRIINEVFNSFGVKQYGPISRLSPYHKEGVRRNLPYDFAPKKAAKLLDKIGYSDKDGDGIRDLPSSTEIKFELIVNKDNRVRAQTARIIADNLAELGIELKIKELGFDAFSRHLLGGNYEAGIVSLLANPVAPWTLSDVFLSTGPLHLWHPGADDDQAEWEKEVDEIFQKSLRASSFEGRKSYYDEFQKIYADQLPIIYTAGESFLYATDERLKNTEEFSRLGTFIDFSEYVWVGNQK